MAEPQYTVFIRVPVPRRGFVDPPPVSWDTTKDEALWKILSEAAQKEIDWNLAADRLEVPVDFLLQQVAYLTERHASKVRAQVRKATAAAKGSAALSPVPGSDSAGIGHLRTASALSLRRDSPMPRNESSTAGITVNTSVRPTMSRNTSANTTVLRNAGSSSPRIGNKPLSRPAEQSGRTRLSFLPMASPRAKSPELPLNTETEGIASPGPAEMSSTTSSDDESIPAQSRIIRRPPRLQQQESYAGYQDDEEDESEPAFQPYKAPSGNTSSHDLTPTLRGNGRIGPRRSLKSTGKEPTNYSQTSDSSAGSPRIIQRPGLPRDQRASRPLSPRCTTDMSGARSSQNGSDGTPSMGSSYSDLDDASVTQSALEEALASHMNRGGASRFSISQAFRSRYAPSSH